MVFLVRFFAAGLLVTGCLAALLCSIVSKQHRTRVENLAILPNFQGPKFKDFNFSNGAHVPNLIEWLEVRYPTEGDFQVGDVQVVDLSAKKAAIPECWLGAHIGQTGAMLTGRIFKGDLYVLTNRGHAAISRGCCADTVRIFRGCGP